VLFPFSVFSWCDATIENAKWWRKGFTVMGLALGGLLHTFVRRRWGDRDYTKSAITPKEALGHGIAFLMVDHPFIWLTFIAHELIEILSVDRKENRLNSGRLYGNRVLVVGNGPSAVSGEQMGETIDKFDEVIRFNNFQTKVAGLEKWVGTKTTVHYSDGLLSPTFREYYTPGATIVLSLFVDRFMVAGSYFIMRGGADLQTSLVMRFLKDPNITWTQKENIERLKKALGLVGPKHPTSGMLAIDYFVNKEGVELPVYIHGFDFFMGPKMHYFDEHEPLWERINDRIGVNMHSPHKEKIYVEKLIAEGKVRFLKDMPK
jgi:hypothetical protein